MSPSNRVYVGSCPTGACLNRIEPLSRLQLRKTVRRAGSHRPWLVVLGALLALLLLPRIASAAGTVTCLTPSPEEEDGRWNLSFNFDYGRVPDMPHIPMMFSFKHVTQHEWSLTDESPEKPIFTRKSLNNMPEINISTDVGFADLSGKIWRSTKKYKIQVRRDAEFEAGEYQLTIREGGRIFGRPMRITLRGKNKPIDRRAINIEAPRPPPKKPSDKTKEAAAGSDPSGENDMLDQLEAELEARDESLDDVSAPPAEKPRQGGCGCAVPGEERSQSGAGLALALGLGLSLVRRTRRRQR